MPRGRVTKAARGVAMAFTAVIFKFFSHSFPNFFPVHFFIFPPIQFFMDTHLKDILMEAVDDTVVARQFNCGGIDFLSTVMDNFIRVYSERFGEDETAAVLAWEKPVVQNLLSAIV